MEPPRPEPSLDAATTPELFARRAREAPEAPCLRFQGEAVSYGELHRWSEILAHRLRAAGVRVEDRVAVHLERGPEMVAALLAVWRAGAAYIPLDPQFPARRLQGMVEAGGVKAVFSRRALPFTVAPELPILDPAPAASSDLGDGGGDPLPDPEAGCLAYVIFTSGSTGQPKGVQVEHRALVNFLRSMAQRPGLEPQDVLVAVTTISFDIAGLELFLPLVRGATVVIAPRSVASDGARLARLLDAAQASVLQATPATWKLLLDAGWSGRRALRMVCGGEALPRDLAQRLLPLGRDLWNVYGPTETTIWSSVARVREESGPVSIGDPIDRTELLVVNGRGEWQPPEQEGDLLIGGDGLARGYLDRPGLTAERFVPHPWAARPGQRLYRTGDRARSLGDGRLLFLGRRDHQVKVQGFRIELGEIEVALRSLPGVAEAVVTVQSGEAAREDAERRLAAYVVPARNGGPEPASEDSLAAERTGHWREIWDLAYDGEPEDGDEALDIRGWKDSYTGETIAAPEMEEWVSTTVERIRGLGARRILEIGSGVGLLVERLVQRHAPHGLRYVATDASPRAVAILRRRFGGGSFPAVEILQSAAAELAEKLQPDDRFDLVVLNSVAQYFPGIEYLESVLRSLRPFLTPGGSWFLGDLRSLPLLEPFITDVLLQRGDPAMSAARLRQEVRLRVRSEEELCFHPAYFRHLAAREGYGAPYIELRRGRCRNEMTGFRYDVVLGGGEDRRIGNPAPPAIAVTPWREDLREEDLGGLLEGRPGQVWKLSGIANGRVSRAVTAVEMLRGSEPRRPLEELRHSVGERCRERAAWDPEEVWERAVAAEWQAFLSWSEESRSAEAHTGGPYSGEGPGASEEGRFDALFVPAGVPRPPKPQPAAPPAPRTDTAWANDPTVAARDLTWGQELRRKLEETLPEYMVPRAVTVVDGLPLTLNGKVDRDALPRVRGLGGGRPYAVPRSGLERQITEIWSELLSVPRVGVQDDFFALGGQSLLAGRLMARLRDHLQLELSPAMLFAAPTPAALAARIEELRGAEVAEPALEKVPRDRPLPLSSAQERMWLWAQMEPGSTAFNVAFAVAMAGRLDAATLDWTLDRLRARHEALRTRLTGTEPPAQRIDAPAPWPLPVVDLGGLGAAGREAETQRLLARLEALPFVLDGGVLVRHLLLRRSTEDHVYGFGFHHIAGDAWSVAVLVREICELYRSRRQGLPPQLPAPTVQYADFAVWQRHRQGSEAMAQRLAQWHHRLLPAMPPAWVSPPRRRSPGAAGAGARGLQESRSARLRGDILRDLHSLAGRHQATLFMTLLAAIQVLVHRYTGRSWVTVGSLFGGRSRPELEAVVGFFVNVLPLAVRLRPEMSFGAALEAVQKASSWAFADQEVPYEGVLQGLRPALAGNRASEPFQMLVIYEDVPLPALALPDLEVRELPFEGDGKTAAYDFTWTLIPRPRGLEVILAFDSGRFDGLDVEIVLKDLLEVLGSAAKDSRRTLRKLPPLSPEMRSQRERSDGSLSLGSAADEVAAGTAVESEMVKTADEEGSRRRLEEVREHRDQKKSQLSDRRRELLRRRLRR
ncbi:MAG: amino acid adenylation domain-containing protein [Acidobacteriota bacterium]|nr:amino acid adenylation domain-containing protein [Acidobacteriota bacterium]